ncbi:hypothetical protein C8J56DRAFT_956083 [Mycena floridula]|nr:hypothetical protein C8J56DRAFT_956083 [Mycena floridula]
MITALFGGAITAVTPDNIIDAADLRQIPDTQEVFLFPDSNVSIVVEILEKVESATSLEDAVKFHFTSLAHDNDATSNEILSVETVVNERGDNTPSMMRLSGVQDVPKFNKRTADKVRVLMALYRIEAKAIDLVVSFNVPIHSEDGGAVTPDGLTAAMAQFDEFTRSLCIVDWGLFA